MAATAVTGKNGKTALTAAPTGRIEISQIDATTLLVPIVGTAPLIMHRFSEKAKKKMLLEMQSQKQPKEPKNPQEEYEAAFYKLEDGSPAFPALAFKAATIGGARFYSQLTMTGLKQCLFFDGELGPDGQKMVRIEGQPIMREDVVRVGRGSTDLRYRPEFRQWRTVLPITFVTSMLTQGSVISLVDAGGLGVGVGEWRPERSGDFGTYRVDPERQIQILQ